MQPRPKISGDLWHRQDGGGYKSSKFTTRNTRIIDYDTTDIRNIQITAGIDEYGLSKILDEEFTFEYPEDTYAHNLFPYIRTELAKTALTMLNIDTSGDSYLFCIVNIADVDRILELAQSIDLAIERV